MHNWRAISEKMRSHFPTDAKDYKENNPRIVESLHMLNWMKEFILKLNHVPLSADPLSYLGSQECMGEQICAAVKNE